MRAWRIAFVMVIIVKDMPRVPRIKNKARAKEYVMNGMQATKAIKTLEPKSTMNAAAIKASRMLRNKEWQKDVKEVMLEEGITKESVINIHKRNLEQRDSISGSNQALDMYYKIQDDYASSKSESLNIHVDLNDLQSIKRRIRELAGGKS